MHKKKKNGGKTTTAQYFDTNLAEQNLKLLYLHAASDDKCWLHLT